MPSHPWQTSEPPRDREIVILARLVSTNGTETWSDPITCRAVWSEEFNNWHDENGLSIRPSIDVELHIDHWAYMPGNEPESEEPEVTVPQITETRANGERALVHPGPLRTYFAAALGERPGDVIMRELKARSFAAGRDAAIDLAEREFQGRPYRLTSLVEQPDLGQRGPVSLALEISTGGRATCPR